MNEPQWRAMSPHGMPGQSGFPRPVNQTHQRQEQPVNKTSTIMTGLAVALAIAALAFAGATTLVMAPRGSEQQPMRVVVMDPPVQYYDCHGSALLPVEGTACLPGTGYVR